MDVLEAIRQRRSIRKFRPDPVPEEALDRLLDAARLAPSGSNRQARKLVVVRDAETRARVAAACSFVRTTGEVRVQQHIAEAPVVIVACGREQDATAMYYREGKLAIASGREIQEQSGGAMAPLGSCFLVDLAIALDHLSLAAVAEGLGGCWVMAADERQLKEILGIPVDIRAPIVMTLGYPDESPDPRPRKALDEVVSYDRYR